MILEFKFNEIYIREIRKKPFEFEQLKVCNKQFNEMKILAAKIELLLKDKFCFEHVKSRGHISLSWEFEVDCPVTNILSCCPTFVERLQLILIKNGIFASGTFLNVLNDSKQN